MKRLLSFVLSFAMVFTMFAPSAYAVETAVDYSDVPSAQSGGYVLYDNGTDGEQNVDYTQSQVFYAQRSAYVWVTDGYENYPVTDYYYANDFSDGLTTTIESDGRVKVVGDYSVIGQVYGLNMVTEMGTYSIPIVINELLEVDTSNDGVWLSKDGVNYQRFEGEPFELGLEETLYFYAVSQGVQVCPEIVKHGEEGIAEFDIPEPETGETVATMRYSSTPSEGTVYGYVVSANGGVWEYCVTLPASSSTGSTADISDLTVYLEYGAKTVKAADTLNGSDYLSVPKGETFAIYAVDSNGNYITSANQVLGISANNLTGLDVGYTSADNDTKLYATVGIPNDVNVGTGLQGFSIGFTDGVVPDGQAPWYSFYIDVCAPTETTTAVFYNVNGTGWQQYDESSTVSFAVYDIVQVYVMYNGTHIPVNTTQFTYDGMNYGSYEGYLDHDADGMYQTLYFTPETAEEYLDCQLYMESLSAPGEQFTFDFVVNDQGKQLTTVENFYFEYSDKGVCYDRYNLGEEISMAPGGRMYLRLVGPDGHIYGEEAALFNTIEDFDDIHITYTAGDRWCIDAGSSFTGKDTIYVVHNGTIYGDVVINVAAVETETGYSDINIIKNGTTSVYDSTPVQVEQDGYFDIAFLDASGQRIVTDYVTVNEEGKTALGNAGISLARKSDRIRIAPSTETPEGTYTAYFTVRDQYAEVKFTVKGGVSYVGEAVLQWGTSMSGLTEYDWKANTLEIVEVNTSDTLYIRFTDGNGTVCTPTVRSITGVNGCGTDNIEYIINDDNVLEIVFCEGVNAGERFINFRNELGDFIFYFYVTDDGAYSGSGEEDYENMEGVPAEKFYGTVNWRISGETEWQTASVSDFVTPEGAIVLDLYEVLELQFIDESGNIVSNISYPRGRQEGQTGYGLYNQTEGAYSALTNSSTAMMRDGGSVVTHIDVGGGYHYVLRYLLQDPYIGEPAAEFDGYAMAVTELEDGSTVYENFENFYPTAAWYNCFGIQFFDGSDNPVDASRVQLINNPYEGFDLTLVTDRDWENAQWVYDNWQVVFNSNAQGGTFVLEFLIDGEYYAAVEFTAQDGSDDADELYCFWDWDFDYEPFQISTKNKTSIGIIADYNTDYYYSKVLFGYVDEETGEFVPYDQSPIGVEVTYNDNGIPVAAEFNGAEIAEAYPEDYANGFIHTAVVIYDSNNFVMTMSGADFIFTDEAVSQFEYDYNEEDGLLEIWSAPATINADIMKETFGDIAKNVEILVIRGAGDYYRSRLVHIEGSDVLKIFTSLTDMNVFGVEVIDSGAFRNLSKLYYVYISDIGTMGDGVFENCTALERVNLYNVRNTGVNTFKNCPKLTTAGTDGYGDWFNINIENYWDDELEGILLPENLFVGSSVKSVYIDGYTHIGENAFSGLSLDELYIGENVRVIDNAFNDAAIGTLYTAKDRDFFFEDTHITGDFSYNTHVPNYVYVITEGNAGEYLGDWYWDDSITWTLYSDGQMIFRGEGAMGDPQLYEDYTLVWDEETQTEVEVPVYYNESDWAYWPATRKIVIEDGITSISPMAFYGMEQIEEIVMADSVTSIGTDAFAGCGFIYSAVIPDSVTDIADNAFGTTPEYLWYQATEVQSVWYAGTQTQWNNLIGSTSQPAFANSDIHTQAVATYELDDRFREARIGLREAGSNSDGYYYYIQVPAGTQLEFVVPENATLENVTVNDEHVFNNTFIATSGNAWVDANIGISNIVAEGEFGSNISWVIDGDTLVISGSGAMKNLASVADAPWFEYLDVIKYIAVEEGVTAVGNNNFTELYNVKGISLPSTVTKTGTNNFLGMPELAYIEVAPGNTAFSAVNGMLMDKAGTTLIKVPAMLEVADGILELPETVTTIKESAFEINHNIRELIVPDNVTTIETHAFACMYSLESITIGNGVKTIPAYAFSYNDSLRTISLGENVSTIGTGAFSGAYSIEEITFQGETPKFVFTDGMLFSADGKVLYTVTDGAIVNYTDSEYGFVVVPYGVETVAERAFYCLNRLEAVQLPASVKTIGKYVFQYCENLVRIIVPASVTKIDTGAFSGSGITNGIGHGTVYYGGTQAQWNKIKANIQSSFDENQDVIFGFDIAGKLNVLSSEFTAAERTKIVKYDALITEEIELSIGVSENPITGETAEYVQPMLTWDMEGYGENFSVMPSDEKEGVYVVTIAAGGTYEFMAYNGDNPKDQVKFTYKVAEKATEVSFNQLKGGHTREGAYVIAAGKAVTPTLKWTGGDNKAWAKGTYTSAYDIVCDDEYRQYVTVDAATGKVTVEKDAPKFNFTVTYTATENNGTMGEGHTVYAEYPMLAVTKLVDKVLVTNENEGFVNLPIGSKVVIDQTSGVTEFTFRANASNDGWAYNEFEFTAPVSQNFTVVDNGDNTATVKLIGGTGSVVVTAKALDGSNKTAKVTFTTGTAVKELNIATTMETTPVDLGDGDILNVIALAKGKSTTLTADILPSTATNKAVTWGILGDPAVATVANGKVTAKAPGMVVVRAVAQDGSGAVAVMGVQVFEAATKVQINGLEGITDGRVLIGEEKAAFALEAIPMRNVFDENGKAIKNQFTQEDVFSDVTWSISGGIAKYVEYEVVDAQYDADGNLLTPAYAVFTADRAGTFSIKATANDGSGKSAVYKVTVAQIPYEMSLTAPKGAGRYVTENGTPAWIIKGDTAKGITVKPTVVFNGGSKVQAVKAPYNAYKLYLDDEEVNGTSVKVYAAGEYLLTAKDYSGNVTAEVVLDIREKSAIDLESLEIKLPGTIGEVYHDVQYAVKGKEFEISRYLNGTLASKIDTGKIDVVWNVTNSMGEPANDVIVTKSNGKSYLKFNASHVGGHSISLTLIDKADPTNTVTSSQLNVVAVEPLATGSVWFGAYGDKIEAMDKSILNPLAGTTAMTVDNTNQNSYAYCQNFEVKSSNAKVLEVVKTDCDTFDVTPKAAGTVTLTIKALDGSGKTFTVKGVKVYPVDSPVNKITVSGTSYSVNPEQAIVVEYGLVSKTGKPDVVTEVSCTDMEWTSSDERIVTVADITAEHETTSVTDSKGNVTYTSKGQLAIMPTDKTGKVTITGKALDGSGKTVKITVTVAKDSATQQLSLNVPANVANGGQTDGTVVLGWGKNLKLTATLKPNKAKNKAVTYKVEAVDAKDSDNVILTTEELAALGVSVNKSGTVAAKAASKKLPNPYTGWVKVTATLNYQMFNMDDGFAENIEAVQYIYIERPMAKMRLTAVNAQNKVVAVTGETIKKDVIAENSIEIDLTNVYTHEVTYKGYSAKVDSVMTDLTTAQPLYSAADNLLWTTNNPALATVDQDGVVTVNQYTKAGTVTITAMAQDGSNVKMTYKITIKAK